MKWRKTAAFMVFLGFLALAGYETMTKWQNDTLEDKTTIRFIAGRESNDDPKPSSTPKEINYLEQIKAIEKTIDGLDFPSSPAKDHTVQ